ncbi:MAG TPA: M1 family peptidase, partial [Candidatus Nitrosotenuis sp.]|nr:M1 family peptidase [Candidatus Nitrosotenuis sp.]
MQVRPINYTLTFEPHFKNFTFSGNETIDVKISKSTNTIRLHAAELKIKSCHVLWAGQKISAKTRLDKKNESLEIKTSKKIKGQAK